MADLGNTIKNLQQHVKGIDQSKTLKPADKKKIKDAVTLVVTDLTKRVQTEGALSKDVTAFNTKKKELKKTQDALQSKQTELQGKIKGLNQVDTTKNAKSALTVINSFRTGGAKPDPNISLLFNDLSSLMSIPQTSLAVDET